MTMPVARFLEPLSPVDQAAVMAMAHPWRSEAEAVLYKTGQSVPGIWLLDVGMVRYEILDHDGRQVVPFFSSAGSCFGELEILEQRVTSVTAITSMPCEGWVMSAAAMMEAIETVPAFSKLMMLKLARNLRVSQMMYQMALVMGQPERLALALLNLAQQETAGDGKALMVVSVTQETLCQVTGSSRQLVSKCLRQWADRGWVAPRYRSLEILDPQGLKSIFHPSINPELFVLLYRTATHAVGRPFGESRTPNRGSRP